MKKILKIFILGLAATSAQSSFAQNETQTFLSVLDSATKEYNEKNWGRAAILWEQLAKANPVNGHFWDYLAAACYHDKSFDKAIPAYERMIELGYAVPANAAYNIACCYSLLKDKQRSLSWLQKAVALGYYYIAH